MFTFVLIKPDGTKRELVGTIVNMILRPGISIAALEYIPAVTAEQAALHYDVHEGKPFFPRLLEQFTGKPVIAMVLEGGENLISEVRAIVGSTDPSKAALGTIRYDLGDDSSEKADEEGRAIHNLIHASDAPESAKNEIGVWFCPSNLPSKVVEWQEES